MDTTAPIPGIDMDESFVNVWFDDEGPTENHTENSKKVFYKSWMLQASAKHSDPSLIASERLRKLYPKHSLVSTHYYDLNVLNFPGIAVTPLPSTPLITEVVFMPFSRSMNGVPGVLVDQVKVGEFEVAWKGYKFLLFMVNFPSGFGTVTQSYILHEGPEEPARLFLMSIGAWSHELHDEVWVFNQGFWYKDRGLWGEIQKADWDDVILKEDFKKALVRDVYGFFSAKDVYNRLSIPWKRGLIMYGPPGNGKTISVKAIMKSCSDNGFIPLYVKSFQSYKGEEGAMADVFEQARQVSPACLILEDLDSLINDRNRSFFLNQLDGMDSNDGLLFIGTTNHFDRLDPGLSSRPSRFDRKYLFDDPDSEERALYAKYWQKKLSTNPEIHFPDALIDSVVDQTSGFSFAYLKEAFVSTLVTLAGIEGDKPQFEDALKEQIHDLRKQLEGEKSAKQTNGCHPPNNVAPFCSSRLSEVTKHSRDTRVIPNASNHSISQQASSRDKIYSMIQQPATERPDGGVRRVHNLLDSLSDSVANMSISRVYKPYVAHDISQRPGGGQGASCSGLNNLVDRIALVPQTPQSIWSGREPTKGAAPPGAL